MKDETPWHERDDFWETTGPFLFARQRMADAPGEVDKIVSLLKLEPGVHVLDLCCGVGRHCLELARRGFLVTGVDRTRQYLEKASEQARATGQDVEFIEGDMRTFCRSEAYDAVLNLFTSFGFFEDPQEDRQVVQNVYRSLKPGGAFIIEMMGKEVLARVFVDKGWEEEDGLLVLRETKVTGNWGWVENRWIMIRDNERVEHKVSHRPYSAVELTSLLTECGFGRVDVYGDYEGSPYDHKAKRLVAVARK